MVSDLARLRCQSFHWRVSRRKEGGEGGKCTHFLAALKFKERSSNRELHAGGWSVFLRTRRTRSPGTAPAHGAQGAAAGVSDRHIQALLGRL